jgi:hypothetical protein
MYDYCPTSGFLTQEEETSHTAMPYMQKTILHDSQELEEAWLTE